MWSEPETPLPNWKNWMVLEGSSEFGEQMASSYTELTVALLPNRFNGVLQRSHFRVHPTPNDDLADLAQTTEGLACLLLRDYAQDPTDRGADTSAVYRYLHAPLLPPGIPGPQVIARASLGVDHSRARLSTRQEPPRDGDRRGHPQTRINPCPTNPRRAPAVVDLTADLATINDSRPSSPSAPSEFPGDAISKTTSAKRKAPETDVDQLPVQTTIPSGTASLSIKQGPSQTRRASTDPHMAHPRSLGTPARPSTLPSRPPPPTRPYAYRHRPSGSLPSQQSSTPASPF